MKLLKSIFKSTQMYITTSEMPCTPWPLQPLSCIRPFRSEHVLRLFDFTIQFCPYITQLCFSAQCILNVVSWNPVASSQSVPQLCYSLASMLPLSCHCLREYFGFITKYYFDQLSPKATLQRTSKEAKFHILQMQSLTKIMQVNIFVEMPWVQVLNWQIKCNFL